MSINWLVAVPTPQGVDIPTYGNYGGPNYSDGRILLPTEDSPLAAPAVDALDALFREHDRAYNNSTDPLVLAQADLQLIRGISALPESQLSAEGHLYAGAATLAFIDQINGRWAHPEIFQPGEEAALEQNGLNNIAKGNVDPDPEEISAVPQRFADLLEYAHGSSTGVDLNDSGVLVSDAFYFARYPDVFNAGIDPDEHYSSVGWQEGRDPNPFFSTNGYLSANPDVEAAAFNPLEHYEQSGWREGRDASFNFDTELYLRFNPDVAAADINPLTHYLAFGAAEGRTAYKSVGGSIVNGFDAEYYLLANPDVGAAGIDAFAHFQSVGWREGRDPNAYFDTSAYLATYSDVAAAGFNPLDHYNSAGWNEGRDPSAEFDTSSYLSAYGDVGDAGINPLQHYLQAGIYEGRLAFSDGLIA
ncbi:hypothetical protein ACFOYU_18670 [Microvirga sp. GCM10011540]|uniref:hypothetical protein n=1 Tax=Microvirga sp. GCM10011540 TaxID=3317338 RepID=UPI00361B46EB